MKPYSESCDQNRDPILSVIGPLLSDKKTVLEIGSGTGQHAVYFAKKMPHLSWHTSDRMENHSGIKLWMVESGLSNVQEPFALDVSKDDWPSLSFDVVYSANTTHIMHLFEVDSLFAGVGKVLQKDGLFLLYGPFNYEGRYTSESNGRFDGWLKARDPESGIRDFEYLDDLAEQSGLKLISDVEMPANNRTLVWQKV